MFLYIFLFLHYFRTVGLAWNGFKDVISQIEKAYEDLTAKDEENKKTLEKFEKSYSDDAEAIDLQYQELKKKKAAAQDAMKKVRQQPYFLY